MNTLIITGFSQVGCSADRLLIASDAMECNHEHCQFCVSISCSTVGECRLVFCPFKCGAKLHKCKLMDHEIICPQMQVECLNAPYGCPYKVYLLLRISLACIVRNVCFKDDQKKLRSSFEILPS